MSARPLDHPRHLDPTAAWAVFLDVDGTLIPIAETPDTVLVGDRLPDILRRLAPALDQALALISGRAIADLDGLFTPLVLPTAGQHGLERRDVRGRILRLGDQAELDFLRGPLQRFAASRPGIILEDKGSALALHYRRAPEAAAGARSLIDELLHEAGDSVRLLSGKMVFEMKLPLADKGAAIAAFMEEPPFAGRRPIFIGDDVTDEDGFAVVNALGGLSIRVGEGRATAAEHSIADVAAVLDWLAALADIQPGAS